MQTWVNLWVEITPAAALVRNPVRMPALLNLPTNQSFPHAIQVGSGLVIYELTFFSLLLLALPSRIAFCLYSHEGQTQHPLHFTFLRVLASPRRGCFLGLSQAKKQTTSGSNSSSWLQSYRDSRSVWREPEASAEHSSPGSAKCWPISIIPPASSEGGVGLELTTSGRGKGQRVRDGAHLPTTVYCAHKSS